MLTRLYIDNYKCMTNFEFRPARMQPIFGLNGTGKTTTFDVLRAIQGFVFVGLKSEVSFPTFTLTRWDTRDIQTFEIDVEGNSGTYQYRLQIKHDQIGMQNRVEREELLFNNNVPLFRAETGNAQLHRDDGSPGPTIRLDWTRSGLSSLMPGSDNTRLTWFKDWIMNLFFVDVNPLYISSRSESEQYYLERGAINFASWYRHLSLENVNVISDVTTTLKEVIDGFDSLSLVAAGENVRILKARMHAADGKSRQNVDFVFEELSDGQRALVVLYTVLNFIKETRLTLCMDEPANFVSLAEIQPYLMSLRDVIADGMSQALVISHHPEVINYFACDNAVELSRAQNGPVRCKPFDATNPQGLLPAEVVARGWSDDEPG